MALTAGILTQGAITSTTETVTSGAATGGTGPYTYAWYCSVSTGFLPASANQITGASSLTVTNTGLIPNTKYYYEVVSTDTGASNATVSSAQLAITTTQPLLSQNAFNQTPYLGVVDLAVGPTNIVGATIDSSAGTTVFYPGQAVKAVANTTGGNPKVIGCTAKSDSVIGFIVFNIKDLNYVAGQSCEVAMWGTVMWLYATGAITQFTEVCLDTTTVGGVQGTGQTATYVGWALDGSAAAGTLIRVMIFPNIAFTTA